MESISDYTEVQFIRFVQELLDAHGSGITEEALDERIHYFCELIEHPDGSNLIYYPEPGADTSAEGITRTIKEWREANGLPGFKPRFQSIGASQVQRLLAWNYLFEPHHLERITDGDAIYDIDNIRLNTPKTTLTFR